MTEAVVDDIVAVLPPLLDALEALGFFARHLHPPAFASVMNAIGAPDDALLPRYSAVWHSTFGRNGPDCWQLGQSHASVQVHELFHTLGAVQLSAPNSDGGGHCTDMPSVMCSNAKPTVRACTNRPVEVLDCGQDDYWNPSPPSGSYLATGDNIATSVFFGPQPQDRLAASPV